MITVSALTADQIIVFQDTYNENGQFVMPVRFEGGDGTVSATLTDEKLNIIDTFKTMPIVIGNKIFYKKGFAAVKSGTYYLNVKFVYSSYYGTTQPITRSLKITHKQPSAKLTFSQTYQAYTDSGDVNQVFQFAFSNASGKKTSCEIYDQYGTFLAKNELTIKNVNGTYTFKWNYYPSKGGLMVSSGTYIIKYWIDGAAAKQQNFEVNLAEG